MKLSFLFITILSVKLLAQEKVSNNDLRALNTVISISDHSQKFDFIKTSVDQYYLERLKDKHFSRVKIGDRDFQKIDALFVKNFINIKYMMNESPKKCKVSHKLFMRGENLSVCKNETQKIKKVEVLISKIKDIK